MNTCCRAQVLRHGKRQDRAGLKLYQFFRARNRQRAQQQGIDNRKDRRVGAYPQRKGRHGHNGEDGGPSQRSQAVGKVLRELVHEWETARVPVQLPGALNASQATEHFAPTCSGSCPRLLASSVASAT